jgi:hypothetical protein
MMHTNVLDSDGFVVDRDALDSWCFATEHFPAPIMHMLVPDAQIDPPLTVLPISVIHNSQILVPLELGLNNPPTDLPTPYPPAPGWLAHAVAIGANGVLKGVPNALIELNKNKNEGKIFGMHRIDQKGAVESCLVFTDLVQGKSFLSQIEKVCDEWKFNINFL